MSVAMLLLFVIVFDFFPALFFVFFETRFCYEVQFGLELAIFLLHFFFAGIPGLQYLLHNWCGKSVKVLNRDGDSKAAEHERYDSY